MLKAVPVNNLCPVLRSTRDRLGNRLEAIDSARDRTGSCSIRINDQYRIYFIWTKNGAVEVEIIDYHGERLVTGN